MSSKNEKTLGKQQRKNFSKWKFQERSVAFGSGNRNYTFTNYQSKRRKHGLGEYSFRPRHARQLYFGDVNRESIKNKFSNQNHAERESTPPDVSDEYTLCKIQETSDMIKRQLMNPESVTNPETREPQNKSFSHSNIVPMKLKKKFRNKVEKRKTNISQDACKKSSETEVTATYNVKEIHDQIVNHISKMNYSRKQNLINADSTNYDAAIQEIYKQKRLDLSKALREMSHQENPEASVIVNSIIPDFAIKFEELPVDVIRELSSTFETFEATLGDSSRLEPEGQCNTPNPSPLELNNLFYASQQILSCDNPAGVLWDDSIVKDEEIIIKDEPIDVIDLCDDASEDVNTGCQQNQGNENFYSNSPSAFLEACAKFTRINSQANVSVSSQIEVAKENPPVGSIRVCKDIFETSNPDVTSELQNGNEDAASCNEENNSAVCSSTVHSVAAASPQIELVNENPPVGTVRVCKNLFETSNPDVTSELQNGNEDACNEENDSSVCSSTVHSVAAVSPQIELVKENSPVLFETANCDVTSENRVAKSCYTQNNSSICSSTIQSAAPNGTNNSHSVDSAFPITSNGSFPSGEFVTSSSSFANKSNDLNKKGKISDNHNFQSTLLNSRSECSRTELKNNEKTASSNETNNTETKEVLNNKQYQSITTVNNLDHTLREETNQDTSINQLNSVADSTFEESSANKISTLNHKQDNFDNSEESKYVSVVIKELKKPKDLTEATAMMLEIDKHIDKLTKLRQATIFQICLSSTSKSVNRLDVPCSSKRKVGNKGEKSHKNSSTLKSVNRSDVPCTNKRKGDNKGEKSDKRRKVGDDLHDSKSDGPISNCVQSSSSEKFSNDILETRKSKDLSMRGLDEDNKCSDTIDASPKNCNDVRHSCSNTENVTERDEDFFLAQTNIEKLNGSPVICKVVADQNTILIGTDNGKLIYYDIKKKNIYMTIDIGRHTLSCLECVSLNQRDYFVYTGNSFQKHLKRLKFTQDTLRKKVFLPDGVQTMCYQWGCFFIGGPNSYITRYNVKTNRIEFEDHTSSMTLRDLKTAKEGALRILVVLLVDKLGLSHVHVRNAMNALHLRTVGEVQKLNCIHLSPSWLYTVSDNRVQIYNFKDGNFISQFYADPKVAITSAKSLGNLLLLAENDKILVFDMKNENKYLGTLPCNRISSITVFRNRLLIGTWHKTFFCMELPSSMAMVNTT